MYEVALVYETQSVWKVHINRKIKELGDMVKIAAFVLVAC